MATPTTTEEIQENEQPLLQNSPKPPPPKTKSQKTIRKTFKGSAQLAKLLPTGSVLTFQILCPVLTHQGQCPTLTSQYLTLGLLIICAVSCFFLRFTDSVRDEKGKVRYGLATKKGLWIIDGSIKLSEEEADKYKLKVIDYIHGFMSVFVFGAVALFDQKVVKCFFPAPDKEVKELLVSLPVVVGVVCSMIFVLFPTKRNGVGSPLSRN